MKKIQIVIIVLLLVVLTWAMYEKSSRADLRQKVQKLESEYLKITKDCDFFRDKARSLQEKLDLYLREKDELLKNLAIKDEYISSLEEKLREKEETIAKLNEQIKNLENLIAGLQAGSGLPKPE